MTHSKWRCLTREDRWHISQRSLGYSVAMDADHQLSKHRLQRSVVQRHKRFGRPASSRDREGVRCTHHSPQPLLQPTYQSSMLRFLIEPKHFCMPITLQVGRVYRQGLVFNLDLSKQRKMTRKKLTISSHRESREDQLTSSTTMLDF